MENLKQKHTLPLVINGDHYEWPEQYITGNQIRQLAKIAGTEELYLKIREPWQDELIENETKVDLARPGIEHFFSKKLDKEIEIIVNGRAKKWNNEKISFKDVIILAFTNYIDKPTMVYTVSYEDGPKQNPEGSMVRDTVVHVKNKMIFHATATDKS